jgi:hypothetical protein
MFGILEWQIKKRRRKKSILFLLDIYYSQKTKLKVPKASFLKFSIAINVQPKFEKK